MKRWLCMLLSVMMILSVGLDVRAADTSFVPCENPNDSLTTLDGGTVSTQAEGKPKVLIFFKTGCGNCSYMLKALKDSGKTYDDLDIIAAEFTGGTLEATKTYCSPYETPGVTYCYDADMVGWRYNAILRPGNNSVTTPLVVYINADNQIVQYSTGYDYDFLKHIEEYPFIKSPGQEDEPGTGGDDGSESKPGTDIEPVEPDKPDDECTYKSVCYRVLTFNGSEGTAEAVSAVNKSITSVNVPDMVEISGYSFRVVSVKNSAFKGCTKLKTVKLDKNVASIGKNAFYGCTALTSVNIPANVKTLGDSTFSGCKKLKTVSGCAGITTIGSKAFYKCEKLVTVGSKSNAITLSKVKTIGNSAFYGCKAVKKVNLTSTALTKIGDAAFQGCTSMTSFISKSTKLTTIGKKAFYDDKKLGTISLKTEKLKKAKVGSNAFKGIKSTCKFKVPKKQVSTYKAIIKAKGAGSKIKVSKL